MTEHNAVRGDLETMPLPRLLAIAGHLTSRHWQRIVERSGLPPTAVVLLSLLRHRDGLTHREAAGMCWVTPGTLTPVVDRLEHDGMVERRRADGDRRVVHLFLTQDGHELADRVRRSLADEVGTWDGGLSDEELAVVRRYLVTTIGLLQDRGNCQ